MSFYSVQFLETFLSEVFRKQKEEHQQEEPEKDDKDLSLKPEFESLRPVLQALGSVCTKAYFAGSCKELDIFSTNDFVAFLLQDMQKDVCAMRKLVVTMIDYKLQSMDPASQLHLFAAFLNRNTDDLLQQHYQ